MEDQRQALKSFQFSDLLLFEYVLKKIFYEKIDILKFYGIAWMGKMKLHNWSSDWVGVRCIQAQTNTRGRNYGNGRFPKLTSWENMQ